MKRWFIQFAIRLLRRMDDADLKREILTEAVKKLYNTIGADDILRENPDGSFTFRGKPIMGAEVAQLKEEAEMLRKMRLWYVLKQDIRHQLGKKMFEEAKVKDDLVWGQLLTYLDDIIRTRLKKL